MKYYQPLTDRIIGTKEAWCIPILREERARGENKAFVDGIQVAWDSTSIGLFKTCPRKYYYSIVLGYEPKVTAPPLAFGIAIHTVMETWHRLVELVDKETALMRVVRLAGLLGETLPPGDTSRTKETLVRAAVWYIEQFWDDKAVTLHSYGILTVEHHFVLPFMEYLDKEVLLCGHLDRVVKWQGQTYVSDYKSTKYQLDTRFFEGFKPSNQMSIYMVANHLLEATEDFPTANGVIIDGIQLGVNFCRYSRNVVNYSLEEINEFIIGLQYWIRQGMNACRDNYFPANEESCGKYSGCHFREVCSKPPARRQAYLDGKFTRRTWDPTQSRNVE